MGNLLFSPSGSINDQMFIKGAVVLLATNFFLWLSWFAGVGVGMLVGFASLTLIYCWMCLFVKRFAYAGKSGAWFLLVFVVFVLLAWVFSSSLISMMSAELIPQMLELQTLAEDDPENLQAMLEGLDIVFRGLAVPYSIGYLLAGGITVLGTKLILGRSEADSSA